MPSEAAGSTRRPTAAEYRAVARPAGLFTEAVNYPVSGIICVVAHRYRVSPTTLTLGNLFLGVNASLVVTVLAVPVAQSTGLAVVVGVLAWLVWQAAYCCDCSDGQLSRVTSTSSAAGGRLDVLCDIAVQVALVGAVAAVTTATRPETPSWLLGVFAASWMINMVTSVMAKEGTNTSLVLSESAAVRLIKLTRDYGFMITMIGFVIAVNPAWMVFLVYAFTAVNVSFLVASIVQATAASHRSDGT